MNIRQLEEYCTHLFSDRLTYMSLCQEIAEHFYPERAEITVRKSHGREFASNTMTSYPILVRRELGDQIGQMLRPTNKMWKRMVPKSGEKVDNEGLRWLEHNNEVMHKAMYATPAQFSRATKEADHDFATFGSPIISCTLNRSADNLLYRSWHIRDVVWKEGEEGEDVLVCRKWRPTARDLYLTFGDRVSGKVKRMLEKRPFDRVKCYHIMVASDLYSEDAKGRPYWSIYYDCTHKEIIQHAAVWMMDYIIPRWQTVSGSQYAFSPATITALPEARMLQAMAFTLLEAGEKATNPPIIATQDVVRSDVALYAGGITWVDQEYDEKLGAALRTLQTDLRGLPFGAEQAQESRELIAQAFYLNKLTLPQRAPEMTAYEVGQRVQEYIRGALPLFEPMEHSYNGKLCEVTFERLFRAGVMGSPADVPRSIVAAGGVGFKFESPLHDAIEEQKGQKFQEAKVLLAEALDIDPNAPRHMVDAQAALREALIGIGIPATWMRSKDDVEALVADDLENQSQMAQLEQQQMGAEIAAKTAQASQAMERL